MTRCGWVLQLGGALAGLLLSVSCGDEDSDPPEEGVPIPEACEDPGSIWADDDGCELDIECSGSWLSVNCNAEDDAFDCSLLGNNVYLTYLVAGGSSSDACVATVSAYLQEPPFEAEPYECTQSDEGHDTDSCNAIDECTREATIGDARITESHERSYGCEQTDLGATCTCHEPIRELWFDLPDSSIIEDACVDVGKWCLGEAVERSGNRDCNPIQKQWDGYLCVGQIECKEPVLASGREATRYQVVELRCDPISHGRFECACPELGSFSIDADDAESACYDAIDICASG